MSTGGGAGKEEDVLGGLTPTTSTLVSLCSSVDRLLGVDEIANLKRIASSLALKWRQPYSTMCGYINSRFAITFVRATHRCIWGSIVPVHKIYVHPPQWEDGSGLNLFR